MAFEDVNDTPAISLGGENKKTKKKNPTEIEGYFLGSREVPDKKKKSGKGYIHDFQTEQGVVGVWGKTDMDRKMRNALIGAMTRVVFLNKQKPTPNGDMWLYQVQQDKENVIEVGGSAASAPGADYAGDDDVSDYESEEGDPAEEETPADEPPPARATPPRQPAATPNAAQQARTARLLGGRAKASA